MPWSNRESSPSPAKELCIFGTSISAAGVGTSLASNLRFISALVECLEAVLFYRDGEIDFIFEAGLSATALELALT